MSLQVEILSDYQLYYLTRSRHLTVDLKRIAEAELNRRNLSTGQLAQLQEEYIRINSNSGPSLSATEKTLIVVFPFFIGIHSLLSVRHLYNNNTRRWKQHWLCVTIGFTLWTVIVFFIAAFLY